MLRLVLVTTFMMVLAWAGGNQCAASEVKLRNWYFGAQVADGQRNQYDIFGKSDALPGTVDGRDGGIGVMVGRRFGDRFLLGFQVVFVRQNILESEDSLFDSEALINGTVLFRQQCTWQPFLRGGFGATSVLLIRENNAGYLASVGTAAVAGGGLQVRLSSRFSLEFETVATFGNFLEVHDQSDDKLWTEDQWQVRTSNYGWRTGLGVVFWF